MNLFQHQHYPIFCLMPNFRFCSLHSSLIPHCHEAGFLATCWKREVLQSVHTKEKYWQFHKVCFFGNRCKMQCWIITFLFSQSATPIPLISDTYDFEGSGLTGGFRFWITLFTNLNHFSHCFCCLVSSCRLNSFRLSLVRLSMIWLV